MKTQTTKIPKTIKKQVWIATREFNEKKLTCAKGEILPGAWQNNSSLRDYLKTKFGKDCITRTDILMEQKTPNQINQDLSLKDKEIKDLNDRISKLEDVINNSKSKKSAKITRKTRQKAA